VTATSAAADRAAARMASPNYRWWVLLVTSTGALLASLTSGTLVIALPDILRELHTDLFALMWIVVGYTLVTTVLVLNAGRLSDTIGRARGYTLGFAIFLVASILCALAPTAETLVGARVLQGVGGAFVMATSAALVTDAFPRGELGRALGINAMVVGAGLILGPILGGWLTGFGWRTVFWFNVPIALIGTIAAATILVDPVRAKTRITVDWLGSGIYLAGLLGLMTALAFGGIYGWTTPWVIAGIVVFLVAAPAFLWVESHRPDPLLDLSLFRIRLFAMGNLTSLLNGVARNGVLFLLVFYLQGAKGDDPVTAGIKLAPLALGLLVLSPISGVLADRYGSRLLATLGMIVTGIGLLGLTTLQVDTPYWLLAIWQLIIGAGSGLFASPNTSAVMGVVPPAQRGVGAGARMMLTNSGFVVSIALSIGLVTSAMDPQVLLSIFSGTQVGSSGIDLGPFMDALHLAFWAGVVASAIGAVVSWNRGEHTTWEDDPVAVALAGGSAGTAPQPAGDASAGSTAGKPEPAS